MCNVGRCINCFVYIKRGGGRGEGGEWRERDGCGWGGGAGRTAQSKKTWWLIVDDEDDDALMLNCPQMSVDILGTSCDQSRSTVQ